MSALTLITNATIGKLITPSKFAGYDYSMNPYVGCEIGCSYCYVRFYVTDPIKPWGEFVRLRRHIDMRLPKELHTIVGRRLVLGTMTDPYQPVERKERLTRRTLEIITGMQRPLAKVGVFTRSTIALDDIELIARMPQARIHITVGPFSRDVQTRIEPIAIDMRARLRMVREFKRAGVAVWINVSPGLPVVSEREIDRIADMLVETAPDGFFVNAMQPYKASLDATLGALSGLPEWPTIRETLSNIHQYKAWEARYRAAWEVAWQARAARAPNTLPLWSHHSDHNRYDLRTGAAVSRDHE